MIDDKTLKVEKDNYFRLTINGNFHDHESIEEAAKKLIQHWKESTNYASVKLISCIKKKK